MAAVAGVDTITITINGIDVEVPKGELIVESVKRLGLEIPIFCYHARMKPVGTSPKRPPPTLEPGQD